MAPVCPAAHFYLPSQEGDEAETETEAERVSGHSQGQPAQQACCKSEGRPLQAGKWASKGFQRAAKHGLALVKITIMQVMPYLHPQPLPMALGLCLAWQVTQTETESSESTKKKH